MSKESEDLREIERKIDQLKIKNSGGESSSVLHAQNQYTQSEHTSEKVLGIFPNSQESNIKNSPSNQKMNSEKKTNITNELNEKYRLIAQNTSDLIVFTTFDVNPTYTFISPSHKKIMGYTEDDLLGKSGLDFIHEDDLEPLMELLMKYIEAKLDNSLTPAMLAKAQNVNFRFRDKSGQWHFLQSTVDIVNDELLFVSKDITDFKKSQDALVESERKYRNLYDNLRDGFAAVDLNGKITDGNAAFVNMLGYSLEELRGLTFEDITPVSWHDFENKILNEQVKTHGYSNLYEKEYKRKDGSIIPIELQTYLLTDDQNRHCGFWAFIRDISVRKKMDSDQRENQERIKAIVMNAPIGIAACGPNSYFINANEAFCKILGYTENELQKMTFADITHPDDLTESNKNVHDLALGKIGCFAHEKHYIKKDKTIIDGRVIVSAIRNQDGTPTLYIAELEDITEQKRMVQALKKSEEKFVKAFKSSPIAIAITRISDGRFLEVNKSLEKLIGYTCDELLSQTTIELNIWVNENDRKNLFEELGKTGSVYDREYCFRSKNGDVIITRYSGEVIDFSGEPAVLSVLVDITAAKKAETLLRESEEKYRSIVENTQDVIMLTNPDGRVDYISPACLTVLGYQPNDIIGKIPEIFYPDDVEKVHSALFTALHGSSGTNLEYRIITKKGDVRWVSHSWSSILDENHQLRYIVSVVRDVTNIKLAEQNLKMKIEELEKYKNITVNREIKMVQLKQEINELCMQLNQKPKYQEG
jgi:PAS domain S-box-containing protein